MDPNIALEIENLVCDKDYGNDVRILKKKVDDGIATHVCWRDDASR